MQSLNLACARQLLAKDLWQFVREPTAAFFTFAFPVIMLGMFGSVWGREPIQGAIGAFVLPEGVTTRYIDIIFPSYIGFAASNICWMSIPTFLGFQREAGYFRALQVSPVSLLHVILIRLAVYGGTFVFCYALLYAVARVGFGVQFHGHIGLLTAAVILCFASFAASGFLLGGLFHSPQTTQVLASVCFFLLFFTSGAAIPRREFPDWLFQLTEYNPLTHMVEILTRIWLGMPFDSWWRYGATIAAFGVVSLLLTLRTFKWDVTAR